VLDLRSNGASSEGTIVFGNNVHGAFLANRSAFINVDRVNANTFNTIQMGTLSMSAGQTLNVTSSNGYNLSFSGGSYTGTGVINFNPAVNSALTIGGGFTNTLTYNNTGSWFAHPQWQQHEHEQYHYRHQHAGLESLPK
jgi:hypothetical protein